LGLLVVAGKYGIIAHKNSSQNIYFKQDTGKARSLQDTGNMT